MSGFPPPPTSPPGEPNYIWTIQHDAQNTFTDSPTRPGAAAVALLFTEPSHPHPQPDRTINDNAFSSPARIKQCAQPYPMM